MHIGVMLHLTPEPWQDASETYRDFSAFVRFVELLGVEEAWVTEHHFQPTSLCPAPHLLMAHFLASTQHLRLGSAATLVGFHEPVQVAEELATLAALAPGRVLAGFARGGPFEAQNRVFGMDGEQSRARMLEAVPAIERLWREPEAGHEGAFYRWSSLDIQPRAQPVPIFLASKDEAAIRLAAQHGYGLMNAQFWTNAQVQASRSLYMQAHPTQQAPDVMLSRGLMIDDDPARASRHAVQHVHDFRAQKSQLWGQYQAPLARLGDDELLQNMLVGTPEHIVAQVRELRDLGVTRLALNPLSWRHGERMDLVGRFMREVWPQVQAAEISHAPTLTPVLA